MAAQVQIRGGTANGFLFYNVESLTTIYGLYRAKRRYGAVFDVSSSSAWISPNFFSL